MNSITYILVRKPVETQEPIPPPEDPKPPEDSAEPLSSPLTINSANVNGEPGTGYEDGNDKGEFECANCEYYEGSSFSCGQEDMMKVSKRARVAGSNRVIVDPEGCCEYVSRVGRKDKDGDDK